MIRLRTCIATLLAGGLLSLPSVQAQLLNSNFADGFVDWTLSSSSTVVSNITRPFPPPGLHPGGAAASLTGGGVLLSSGFVPTAPDFISASALSQTFSLRLPTQISGPLGKGVGRLRVSNFDNVKPHATLSFNAQFFSNERGTPFGNPAFDYAGGLLNKTQILSIDNKSTLNGPPASGFSSSSAVQHVALDVTSLIGTNPTLLFFASDTGDLVWKSGLLVNGFDLHVSYLREDGHAIHSVYATGLPVGLVQRELLLNVAFNANRDVNARLFRLRSEVDEVTGAAGPSGDGKESKESKKEIVPEEKRWAFYATGAYGYRDQNNIDQTAGFQTDLFTATIGAEYRLTPYLTLGIAASRIEADNDLGSLGSADIEGWSYDAYVSYSENHFYADLLYALGTYNNQINRNTGFLGETATARPDSLTSSLQFNTGYNLHLGRVITGPLASLNWVYGKIDGYNEQQGGNANLTVAGQQFNSLTSEFGWQLSVPLHTTFGSITPQVRASWVHDYLNTADSVIVGLQNSPYYFVDGASVSRFSGFNAVGSTSAAGADYMSVGAGIGCTFSDRASVVVDWESHFFQDHASSQNVSLTGQIKF